jgi:hypothetical protein
VGETGLKVKKKLNNHISLYDVDVFVSKCFHPNDIFYLSTLMNKSLIDICSLVFISTLICKEKHSELRALQREFDEGDHIHAQ